MEKLIIKQQADTPAVVFLPHRKKYQISGPCWPENPAPVFDIIYDWVENHLATTSGEDFILYLKITFMNTSCSKHLLKLINYILNLSDKNDVKILWYYNPKDTEMFSEGRRFQELSGAGDQLELIESDAIPSV